LKARLITWKTISSLSRSLDVARDFSNNNGIILEVDVVSSRDISRFSVYSTEDGVLLLPYSCLEIVDVIDKPGQPALVQLGEIPIPRGPKVVFWVDDNPENNYKIAATFERWKFPVCFAHQQKMLSK